MLELRIFSMNKKNLHRNIPYKPYLASQKCLQRIIKCHLNVIYKYMYYDIHHVNYNEDKLRKTGGGGIECSYIGDP